MKKLILFFLLLISLSGFSQLIQVSNTYGIGFHRTGADVLLYLPGDTVTPPAGYNTLNFVAIKNGGLYRWNSSAWASLSGVLTRDRFGLTGEDNSAAENRSYNMHGSNSMLWDSIGNNTAFLLKPTTGQTSQLHFAQKIGSDSVYWKFRKPALGSAISTEFGLWSNSNSKVSRLSIGLSGGIPVVLLGTTSTANSSDINLRIDGTGINFYAQNSGATANTLVRAEPDSVVINAYKASDATRYTYLNTYLNRIYGYSTHGSIEFGSHWADQYADSVLKWRTTDNTGEIRIEPSEVAIYAEDTELEITPGVAFFDNTAHNVSVGINTNAPTNALSVTGNADFTGNVGIVNASPTAGLEIGVSGGSSSSFRLNSNDEGTPFLIYSNNNTTNVMSVNNGSAFILLDESAFGYRLGLGTNNPTTQLHTTGGVRFEAFTAGAATFDGSGNITSVSDGRAKHSIKPFKYGLKEILGLKTSTFIYNQDKSNTVMSGFIAQDVQKVIPTAVHTSPNGMLSLETNAVLAASVNGIKELYDIIQKQDQVIKSLEKRIKTLEKK